MEVCRDIGVLGRPRVEGGSQKFTIVAFHKNCKLNPILSFRDRCVIYFVVVLCVCVCVQKL